MHSALPIRSANASPTTAGRRGRVRQQAGVALVVGIFGGVTGLVVDLAAQAPRPPSNVRVLVDGGVPAPGQLTVTCPANKSVASSNGSPVVVTYSVSTSGGAVPMTVTDLPASGSSFPVGTTPVQSTARSNDGQTATCGFSVTVTYSPAPSPSAVGPQSTITCPAGAIAISPGASIQAAVNLHPGTLRSVSKPASILGPAPSPRKPGICSSANTARSWTAPAGQRRIPRRARSGRTTRTSTT